ncbi:hypothetical protein [Ralstonia pseudosolanacearum]|uniref:hypothetical protein n=1 Tax=Ralstonia pseudosolanacearum TaxID=1310165 RepID=UPI003CE7FE57
MVDLSVFANGQVKARGARSSGPGAPWNGPFQGRKALIEEMAPAIYDHLVPLAEKSVVQFMNALRAWWRLFDALEAEMPEEAPVSSVAQLTELHRQRAFDRGMDRLLFGNFLLLANKTRAGLGLRPLYWQRPGFRSSRRHLPPQWQTDLLRHELKHRWFAVLDRWELASKLLHDGAPLVEQLHEPVRYEQQKHLLRGYRLLATAIARSRSARPNLEELCGDQSKDDLYSGDTTLRELLRGRYPDGGDIRTAFHLCLATTGWNPAVFLALNVEEPFIEPHPIDSSRYILRGIKDRAGGTEQVTEGLFKSRGGAGFILRTLMEKTAPLREELRRELEECRAQLSRTDSFESDIQNAARKRIGALERGIRSPWLYVSHGVHWLTDYSFHANGFLSNVIADMNRKQPADQKLADLTASDLRDAYAARVYHASGGSVLAVMKALNHRRLKSTQVYLDNTLLREEHRRLYGTFSAALWEEIRVHRRVDPTILAMWSRHGEPTPEHRARLETYRNLLRSRIGVGCEDPWHPPKHIAPDFKPDGEKKCPVHRCLLCLEHAVIFPESLPGMCKRLAELRYLQRNMSAIAFAESSFGEEMANTELALLGFDQSSVAEQVAEWEHRIANGAHRVIEFDGQSS